jgi:hypothetical protein
MKKRPLMKLRLADRTPSMTRFEWEGNERRTSGESPENVEPENAKADSLY